MTETERKMVAVADALKGIRVPAATEEYDIHAEIAAALSRAGIAFVHEYRLAPRCRIDFLAGSIGIEVKKARPVPSQLREQLARYLQSDALEGILVVTQRAVLLPQNITGKPVRLVSLNRLWGVALP